MIKPHATRFKFAVGIGHHTTVTVKANSYVQAVNRAREEMDRRYEKADREPPVGWDLTLLEATPERKRR